ncbi:MAG: hypothetical protein LBE82_01745, partial [Chitinophagaceae bacterium]|nr:hypothetical protein [Chitinophagaceae bacterium]
MKKIAITYFCCLQMYFSFAQNTIGLPHITNYTTDQSGAGTQTWCMDQDKRGIMYFANNDGLITFNGKYWKIYPLPNKTIVRSIAVDTVSGKIYVGGQDEIGYFFPDDRGELTFRSLKNRLPENNNRFADVWNIVFFEHSVFFRTTNRIFEWKDDVFTVYNTQGEWRALAKVSGRLLAQEQHMGLVEWKHGAWETICPTAGNLHITSILEYNADTALITTNKNGIFLFQSQKNTLTKAVTVADKIWTSEHIYCARKVNENRFAVGTTTGGCYITDINGNVIQRLTKTEGIQNNNILSLFLDREQNLWMGLDNGIDFVAYNAAVKNIFPDKADQPSGYAVRIFDHALYIGTSNGLYYTPLKAQEKDLSFAQGNFSQVTGTTGQVWGLYEVNNTLLMGHHEGAFVINKNTATSLGTGQGAWLFMPMSPYIPSPDVLSGNYTGLELLHFEDNRFSYAGKVEGITESFRFLAIDNNVVWTSHPYRGVFKIELSPDKKKAVHTTLYGKDNGLPSNLNNYVFRVKNRVVITTEKGVYEYNPATDQFMPSEFFAPIFGQRKVRYLMEDNAGNVWFVSEKAVGVIDFSKKSGDASHSIIYFPELTGNIVSGFIHIYPYDEENVFIGGNKGIYHINYTKYTASQSEAKPEVLLDQVKAVSKKDSIIYGGYYTANGAITNIQDKKNIISLPNRWNSFHFEYSSVGYSQLSNIAFSYQLEGFDNAWSDWSSQTQKDYTNLPYGTYTFKVKSRNNLGKESEPVSYTFRVLPAWYQTKWAYLIYLLLAAAGIFFLQKRQEAKIARKEMQYREEQKKLLYLHQLELDR